MVHEIVAGVRLGLPQPEQTGDFAQDPFIQRCPTCAGIQGKVFGVENVKNRLIYEIKTFFLYSY